MSIDRKARQSQSNDALAITREQIANLIGVSPLKRLKDQCADLTEQIDGNFVLDMGREILIE
jgi:hypothetical protein